MRPGRLPVGVANNVFFGPGDFGRSPTSFLSGIRRRLCLWVQSFSSLRQPVPVSFREGLRPRLRSRLHRCRTPVSRGWCVRSFSGQGGAVSCRKRFRYSSGPVRLWWVLYREVGRRYVLKQMCFDYFGNIFRPHASVESAFGIDDNERTAFLQKPWQPVSTRATSLSRPFALSSSVNFARTFSRAGGRASMLPVQISTCALREPWEFLPPRLVLVGDLQAIDKILYNISVYEMLGDYARYSIQGLTGPYVTLSFAGGGTMSRRGSFWTCLCIPVRRTATSWLRFALSRTANITSRAPSCYSACTHANDYLCIVIFLASVFSALAFILLRSSRLFNSPLEIPPFSSRPGSGAYLSRIGRLTREWAAVRVIINHEDRSQTAGSDTLLSQAWIWGRGL